NCPDSPELYTAAFFFQAEDGIRDFHVTGVQTCALPISQAAEQRDDLFLSLDSWRMASFCMERNKDEKQAWDYAKQSLDISRRMDAQQRSQSTLPFLGQAMIRLSPSAEVRDQVKLTFSELLNEDWLEQVQQVAKAC